MINTSDVITSLISALDSYKIGMSALHNRTFTDPAGKECHTEIKTSYSNLTPRKNCYMDFSKYSDGKMVVWGTRHTFNYVINFFKHNFFNQKWEDIEFEMRSIFSVHYGNGGKSQQEFIDGCKALHAKGRLPIRVRALKEGTRVQPGIPVMTIESEEGFSWVVNAIETITSNLFWPMINTATIIEQFYIQARQAARRTIPEDMHAFWLPYCVHEFGLRGMFGPENGLRMASAHALFFQGTDTTGVIPWMKTEYDHGYDQARPAGVSVRALEHADVTRLLSEYRYRGFNEDTEYWVAKELAENSTGIISYVSDSENYFRMIRDYALRLKPVILARKDREDGQPARFVFRPDSSRKTPLEVICGYDVVNVENLDEIQPKNWASDTAFQLPDGKYFTHTGKKWEEISHDEVRGSLDIMWEVWGGTEWNNFKIINPKVGLIYGEAISVEMQQEIYETMERKGFSAFNILMGKGSYASLKNNTRDMFSITYKQTFSTADLIDLGETGVELVQQKSPMGADYKKSAAGRLRVDNVKGELVLVQNQTKEQAEGGLLEVLVDNGVIITNGNSFMDAVNTHSVYFKAMEDDIINEESVLEFLSANIGK